MQLSSEFFAYITTVRLLYFLHVIKSLQHRSTRQVPPGPATLASTPRAHGTRASLPSGCWYSARLVTTTLRSR